MAKITDEDVDAAMAAVRAHFAKFPENVRSIGDLVHHTRKSKTLVERAIHALSVGGEIVSSHDYKLYARAYGTRKNGTYYMLPAYLEKLKSQALEAAKEPFHKEATRIIVQRHGMEYDAVFDALWAEHLAKESGDA